MASRLLLSRVGVLYHDPHSGWVWNDPVRQKTFHLSTAMFEAVTRAHGNSIEDLLQSVDEPGRENAAARLLRALEAKLLIFESSEDAELEDRITASWVEYGRIAEAFHYGTRTGNDTPFDPLGADPNSLLSHAATTPPPDPFKIVSGITYRDLPPVTDTEQPHADLVKTLMARHTPRDFTRAPIAVEQLSALLQICARPVPRAGRPLMYDEVKSYFKVAPSGGARHPTDWYLNVHGVRGLEAGSYHYDPASHALGRIGDALEDEALVRAAGGQPWVADGAVQIIYVSETERNRWKYQMARAYRALNLDVGHISQAVFLVAEAMRMKVAFIGSFRDEPWEVLFNLRHCDQLVLGMSILGGNE